MKRSWTAVALFAFLSLPAMAAEEKKPPMKSLDEAAEATRQALEGVLNTFRGLIESFPAYEAPVILDNGDILIRRKRSEPPKPSKPEPKGKDGELKT